MLTLAFYMLTLVCHAIVYKFLINQAIFWSHNSYWYTFLSMDYKFYEIAGDTFSIFQWLWKWLPPWWPARYAHCSKCSLPIWYILLILNGLKHSLQIAKLVLLKCTEVRKNSFYKLRNNPSYQAFVFPLSTFLT